MARQRKKTALFIGRFQPLHKGHMSIIEGMGKSGDISGIVIGIGTSQISHTIYNPFTAGEREKMIKHAMKKVKKPCKIVLIPDINDHPNWVRHVERLCPAFNVVYSGNATVKRLFNNKRNDKKYEIRTIRPTHRISATEIREMMIKNDVRWVDNVPVKIACYLSIIRAPQRMRDLCAMHLSPGLTADIIINYRNRGIVLIKRKNEPFKGFWALPGGFINTGKETIEQCAAREAREETSLKISVSDLSMVGIYSYPFRDPRGHTVSVAYHADIGTGRPKARDDATDIGIFKHIPTNNLAFDHGRILKDYRKIKQK